MQNKIYFQAKTIYLKFNSAIRHYLLKHVSLLIKHTHRDN